MDLKAIKDLVKCAFKGITPDPTKFSCDVSDVKSAANAELKELASSYNNFQRNRYDIYEILQENFDDVLPKYVEDFMGAFAEIKHVPLNQKAQFVRKRGRQRAKQFITRVGLSGVYEAFRLDKDTFEVSAHAIGGAAIIDFERWLAGDEDITESMDILLEGIQEAMMGEVQKALIASINAPNRPARNVYSATGFNANAMQKLVNIAKAYGSGAVIFATPDFIAEMGPDAIVPGTVNYQGIYSPKDINDIANTGLVKSFRGTPIVEIPQSFTDETNEVTQMNPALAYIFPTGGEKVVKIVMEGNTQIDDFKNRDRSMEIEAYTRFGVAILTNHNWCIYENQDLANTTNYPTKYPVQ